MRAVLVVLLSGHLLPFRPNQTASHCSAFTAVISSKDCTYFTVPWKEEEVLKL